MSRGARFNPEQMPEGMRKLYEEQYLREHETRQAKQQQPMPAVGDIVFRSANPMLVGTDLKALEALNKTERWYLDTKLVTNPDVVWIGVHVFKLRLASNTYYTPDFAIMNKAGILTMIDTKGQYTREDAQLKIKLAARIFFMFRWLKVEIQLPTSRNSESVKAVLVPP